MAPWQLLGAPQSACCERNHGPQQHSRNLPTDPLLRSMGTLRFG